MAAPTAAEQSLVRSTHSSEIRRQEFGAIETKQHHETAAMATAAREKAVIEARFIYAMRNPRDVDDFQQALYKECRRPSFAAKAKYSLPKGKKKINGQWVQQYIEGPSIRLIETALRCFKNSIAETSTVYESEDLRILRIGVTDLESNIAYTSEVQVTKTVERKGVENKNGTWAPPEGKMFVPDSRYPRPNSYGEQVWLVFATDDEILMKQNALISKCVRTNALRFLPGDIIDEALAIADKTANDKDASDPDAAKKKVLDSFAVIEVMPSDITKFLGHPTDRISPAELDRLRKIYAGIRDGETTWDEVMKAAADSGSEESPRNVAEQKIAQEQTKADGQAQQSGAQQSGGGLFGGAR